MSDVKAFFAGFGLATVVAGILALLIHQGQAHAAANLRDVVRERDSLQLVAAAPRQALHDTLWLQADTSIKELAQAVRRARATPTVSHDRPIPPPSPAPSPVPEPLAPPPVAPPTDTLATCLALALRADSACALRVADRDSGLAVLRRMNDSLEMHQRSSPWPGHLAAFIGGVGAGWLLRGSGGGSAPVKLPHQLFQ